MSDHISLFLISVLLTSCAVREISNSTEITGTVAVTVSVSGDDSAGTRSILPEKSIENLVTDLTVASYSEDGMLVDVCYCDECPSEVTLNVRMRGSCRFYALANVGDMSASFPVRESHLQNLVVTVPEYEKIAVQGMPMCGFESDVPYDADEVSIALERLFAKVCMRIRHSGIHGASDALYVYNLCNKSAYVRQANGTLRPFAASGSKALSPDDVMSVSDFNQNMNDRNAYEGTLSQSQLGPGPGYFQDTTFVFYVPENIQGVLLPENDDPLNKDYANISDISGVNYGELCTYMEFNAQRVNNGVGYSGSVSYRCYLGEDNVSDFSIRRNRRYDIQLELTEKGLFADSWKVTQGNDWSDSRVLHFLEDPYVVYKGYDENVMVHYHRMTTSVTSSQKYPDDWYYEIDEEAMTDAGLIFSYDPDVLVKGQNGMNDYCIRFSASEDAVSGAVFPIRIVSWDGALSDYATLQVAEMGNMTATWTFCPQYVSQYGILIVGGVPEEKKPIELETGELFETERINDTTFRVVAVREGEGVISWKNSDGTQTNEVCLDIKAPLLDLYESRVSLNPDGTPRKIGFAYCDHSGKELDNIDEVAFRRFLTPSFSSPDRYCRMETDAASGDGSFDLWIDRLYDDDGVMIDLGAYERVFVAASGCTGVEEVALDIYHLNPFRNIVPVDYGRLDDYTLFMMSGVHPGLADCFAADVKENSYRRLDAPVPDADLKCLSVYMRPAWLTNFSYHNDVFGVCYILQDDKAYFDIRQNPVSASVRHGAGKHQIVMRLTNPNSGEFLECICGGLDVYVHVVMGAEADFGYRQSSYAPAGQTSFARVYNSLAGAYLYPENSSSLICFMDVSVRFPVDVGGIRILEAMLDAAGRMQNDYDALDIISPSVYDGYKDQSTSLLYSVWSGDSGRVNVGGEPSSRRAGVGNMIYRALKMRTYASSMTSAELQDEFIGTGSAFHAPAYHVHNMSSGADMQHNIVLRNNPFYFAPTVYPQYKDADGNGYHVIHFLDDILPYTGGWINLL